MADKDAVERPEREVIEVEAERLPLPGEESAPRAARARVWSALSPVLAGLAIDLVDFATRQPPLGALAGAVAGFWISGRFLGQRELRRRLITALACGVYCALPITTFLPIGTVLGVLGKLNAEPGSPG